MAGPPRPSDPVGIDVSWPQCGKTLPKRLAFAIVGVNSGLANTTNPCLGAQLDWADSSVKDPHVSRQPRVALYANTANPGLAGSWWPRSNVYGGSTVANPYGECKESENSAACAYIYGYAKAYDDAVLRGVDDPQDYFWWLDAETENSWQPDNKATLPTLKA